MREIKFRAWNSVLNEYRKLDMNSGKQNLGMGFEVMGGINSNITTIYHSVGDVIEQYTGLKDVHGVEIYEGDILQDPDDEGFCYEVEYDYGRFSCGDNDLIDCLGCTVVGNRFDNPELLEAGL